MSNVIVVGCGRVGSQLANMLSDNGSNVCVIDRSADAFANLGRNFNGSTLQGVGFDEDTLVKAGVDDCDVVAAVTQLDNTNLMVAEVASRLFGVPHVIARLYNPDHERAYMQLGIDVDRDLADLAHSARTAFLTSPASLSRPRFLIMGAIRFASGFWGEPSTLNMALKTSLAIDG